MKSINNLGQKPGIIICIHGNSSSSFVFKEFLHSEFIKQTKIAVDLPGHGSNLENYKNHTDFSISFFKEKLIAFINTIDDEILLVGNSLGGHLAIEIANEIKKLKGLVIFGTPPVMKPINFEEAFLPATALHTFLTENPTEEAITEASNVAVYNKDSTTAIIADFKKTNSLVRKMVAEDILGNNLADEYEIFTKLEVPKFIIAGQQDPSVNKDYLKKVTKKCKNNCELIFFDNCGHYPSLEKPDLFIRTMMDITSKVFLI
ncbi:alpha/beta fold hydrolase [Polaribacter sp. Hel_I_88]|uniref:alpha/beta fold hydrolase n=1 Tax=Polaribacter sp. Hel_I_88 TaxID=1250006 RepID=UPI00047EC287|nr:alpha/beta hydrolase [Polaribacter sp. Hel_I_88]